MELHKKCFEFSIYKWAYVDNPYLCREAWSDTVYADTASKARYAAYLRLKDSYDDLDIIDILVRRKKSMDLYIGESSVELITLTKEQVNKMKHAVGFDSSQPFYRNYYNVGPDDMDWPALCIAGLAESHAKDYYHLTEKGCAAIRSLIPRPINTFSTTTP